MTADGRSIASVSSDHDADIWLAPSNAPDRAHARRVTTHGQQINGGPGVAWAADGRLVYGSLASGNGDIWIMKADGTEQKQLTDDPRVDYEPLVTPDGRTIVFFSGRSGNYNLWRMNLDGGDLKQLTSGKDQEYANITPDGRAIIYEAPQTQGGADLLWRQPLDGGAPTVFADFSPESVYSFAFSPDGKQLALSLGHMTRDAVLVTEEK